MATGVGIRRKFTTTVDLDANGEGIAEFPNNNSGAQYVVEQVSVYTVPRKSGVTAELYEGNNLVDTAYFAGTGDTATGPPWLYIDSGDVVKAAWENGPASGQGVMTVWYSEVVY